MSEPDTTLLRLEYFDAQARAAVANAQRLADQQHHCETTTLHLLSVLLERGHGLRALRAAGQDPEEIAAKTAARLALLVRTTEERAYLERRLVDVLQRAERSARKSCAERVTVRDLFDALAAEGVVPKEVADHWDAEQAVPLSSDPPARFSSPEFCLLAGKRTLRELIRALQDAATPGEALERQRAIETLEAVESALTWPSRLPDLLVSRESLERLRIKRTSQAGEIVLSYSSSARSLVLSRAARLTTLEQFHWSSARNCWAKDSNGGDFFEVLHEAILQLLYPELRDRILKAGKPESSVENRAPSTAPAPGSLNEAVSPPSAVQALSPNSTALEEDPEPKPDAPTLVDE